jgi:hypothetical protein
LRRQRTHLIIIKRKREVLMRAIIVVSACLIALVGCGRITDSGREEGETTVFYEDHSVVSGIADSSVTRYPVQPSDRILAAFADFSLRDGRSATSEEAIVGEEIMQMILEELQSKIDDGYEHVEMQLGDYVFELSQTEEGEFSRAE